MAGDELSADALAEAFGDDFGFGGVVDAVMLPHLGFQALRWMETQMCPQGRLLRPQLRKEQELARLSRCPSQRRFTVLHPLSQLTSDALQGQFLTKLTLQVS